MHEIAHGYVAYYFGDSTAKNMGRLTLNPIAHIDLFGTIILPAILILSKAPFIFGGAKPVPVNFNNLRNPKRHMVFVSLAGPGTNFLLAILSAILIKLIFTFYPEIYLIIGNNAVAPQNMTNFILILQEAAREIVFFVII